MNNIVSVRVLLMAVVVAALFTGTALAADPAPFYAASIKEFETRSATADPDNWRFVYLGDNREFLGGRSGRSRKRKAR